MTKRQHRQNGMDPPQTPLPSGVPCAAAVTGPPSSGRIAAFFKTRAARIQKILVVILMGAVALASPFILYDAAQKTAYEVIAAAVILMSVLLLLYSVYFLNRKNTALQKSQEFLKASSENFGLIAANISEMISKHMPDGRYTYVSPSCKNLLGYTPEELLGVSPYDLFHPESISEIRKVHRDLFESGETLISTYQIRRKDGAYLWLETSNILICDPSTQEPREILCVSRDVSRKMEEETQVKKLMTYTEELLQTGPKKIQYQKILENMLSISGAKIGFITLLNETTGKYATQTIAGMDETLKKINQFLGYDIAKEEWFADCADVDQAAGGLVTKYSSLSGISGALKSEILFRQIEEFLPYGEVAVVKIIADNQIVGNFTLIMPFGEHIQNESFIEIYSRQVNVFMTRLKAEEMLKTGEDRLLSAQSMAHVGNWELNLATRQMWASKEAFFIYGIPHNPQSIPLDAVQAVVFPEFRKRLDDALQRLVAQDEPYDEEFKIRNAATGKTCYVHSKAIRLTDEEGNAVKVVGAIQDITTYKKSEEEILYLSFHDQLTGLYNRRFYEESLAFLDTPENLPITLAMGDVNGLKLVNDSFGHVMGDTLLRKAADVISRGSRKTDIAARLGGDEFVIVMPGTDTAEAEEIIGRIMKLAASEKIGALDLSISFGYDTKRRPEEDIHHVIKSTEDHMYRNKLCESTSMRNKTIDLIINTLYEKNHREMLHSKRVSILCEAIATKMNLERDEINQIKIAGLMHDIGKIGIDDKILNKPAKLAKDEWKEIERHAEIGYRILSSVNEFSEIADYILEHHERWDGTGYPRGLKGKEISLPARIIVFAESYESMTGPRGYRAPLSEDEALEEIRRCSGTQFDPEIAELFIDMMQRKI